MIVTTPETAVTDGSVATDPTTAAVTVPPETAPATTAASIVQNYGNVDPGDLLFRIVIPRTDDEYNVVAGVSSKDLAKGPGHFADTPPPGQLGNTAIAGHRTGHGGPFLDLDQSRPGGWTAGTSNAIAHKPRQKNDFKIYSLRVPVHDSLSL